MHTRLPKEVQADGEAAFIRVLGPCWGARCLDNEVCVLGAEGDFPPSRSSRDPGQSSGHLPWLTLIRCVDDLSDTATTWATISARTATTVISV